jgi:hypothetical protein
MYHSWTVYIRFMCASTVDGASNGILNCHIIKYRYKNEQNWCMSVHTCRWLLFHTTFDLEWMALLVHSTKLSPNMLIIEGKVNIQYSLITCVGWRYFPVRLNSVELSTLSPRNLDSFIKPPPARCRVYGSRFFSTSYIKCVTLIGVTVKIILPPSALWPWFWKMCSGWRKMVLSTINPHQLYSIPIYMHERQRPLSSWWDLVFTRNQRFMNSLSTVYHQLFMNGTSLHVGQLHGTDSVDHDHFWPEWLMWNDEIVMQLHIYFCFWEPVGTNQPKASSIKATATNLVVPVSPKSLDTWNILTGTAT